MNSPTLVVARGARRQAPSHPFGRRWYAHRGGRTLGPHTGYEIRRMAARGELAATDLVYAEGGGDWVQLKDDPILGILYLTPEPSQGPLPPAREGRLLRFPTRTVAVVIVAAIAGWIAWPYYTAYGLAVAVRDGDVAFLQEHVDWESVRAGLRNDLKVALLQKLTADPERGSDKPTAAPNAAFAAAIGPAIVDQVVNSYVTPEVVASLNRKRRANLATEGSSVGGSNARGSAAPVAKIADAIKSARKVSLNDIKYAFFEAGPFKFKIDFVPNTTPPMRHAVSLRFAWDGSWKLTRVILPMQEIGALPSRP